MSNIIEFINSDAEVFSSKDFKSEKEFEFKLLNSLSFETITDFYIKKTIIEAVREKSKLTNGSNGVTDIELINLLKWKDIEKYLNDLESKNIIKMQKGINSNMYFLAKK